MVCGTILAVVGVVVAAWQFCKARREWREAGKYDADTKRALKAAAGGVVLALLGIGAVIEDFVGSSANDRALTAAQTTADNASAKVADLEGQLGTEKKERQTDNDRHAEEMASAQEEIRELQPKPLKVRLRALLNEINPTILHALTQGTREFRLGLTTDQLAQLQGIANEPDAAAIMTFVQEPSISFGDPSSAQQSWTVLLTLDPAIFLNDPPPPE